jgi:TolA-binding protein
MMKEKSETTVKSNLYKDQIEELKEQIEELKQNNQNQAKEQDGLVHFF